MLHLVGCTAYRPAGMPGENSPSKSNEQEYRELSEGDSVRITLRNGTILTGDLKTILPGEIILEKTGNFGLEEFDVSLSDISVLEVEGVAGPLGLLRGTAIIVGVFVGTAIALIIALGGFPEEF